MADFSLTRAGALPNQQAATNDARLKQVAEGFENVFLQLMLKRDSMGADSDNTGLLDDSQATGTFKSLFNQGIGEHAAGNFGVAETLYDQLRIFAQRSNTTSYELQRDEAIQQYTTPSEPGTDQSSLPRTGDES